MNYADWTPPASVPLRGYAVAGAAIALAAILRVILRISIELDIPLVLAVGTVLVAAAYGGLWPGLLATLAGVVHGGFFPSAVVTGPLHWISVLVFAGVGAFISMSSEEVRAAQRALLRDRNRLRHEIAERERADARLRDREEQLLFALEAGGMIAWDWNISTGATTRAGSSARVFGIDFDQAENFLALVHPDDQEATNAAIGRAVSGDGPYDAEFRIVLPISGERWVRDTGRLRVDPATGERHLTGVTRDISEQKQAELRVQNLVEELRHADRRKDQFLATLAHELRNPLAPIRNSLYLLERKGPHSPEVEWAKGVIERQTQQMTRLIDDLLDLSRITHDRLQLRKERVDLRVALHGAIETARPAIEAGRHELAVDLPADMIIVNADITRLAQVFANLLSNAAKYTPPEGRIVVTARVVGGEAVISVSDTGIGIPPEMLSWIFEIFGQVDTGLERSRGGLGIGLSIARRLVEMHSGTLLAESAGPGEGSRFTVRLPVAALAPDDAAAGPGRPVARHQTRQRVLIADDNRDAAASLSAWLSIVGHETRVAHDGEEAVALARDFAPDVAILDIGMPRLNGYDAAEAIRRQGRRIRLIALSGWGRDEDKRKSREAGFDCHLVKPVVASDLMQALEIV